MFFITKKKNKKTCKNRSYLFYRYVRIKGVYMQHARTHTGKVHTNIKKRLLSVCIHIVQEYRYVTYLHVHMEKYRAIHIPDNIYI